MKIRFFKSISSFYRSESGVSVAVAAALLLGIIVAAMTTIQLNYVPVWKEDAEYAHMSDAWQDMSRLKSNVDILAAGLEMNPNAKIVLSTPISVGGSDVPFIGGMTTGGTLAINNDISGLSIIVDTNTSTGGYNSQTFLHNTGTVKYRPTNTYYVDETYSYENGALIVAREGRSMMKLTPAIVLENGSIANQSAVNLSVNVIFLKGPRGVMSSNTVEDIRLTSKRFTHPYTYTNLEKAIYNNSITSASVTVYTENTEAWEKYFEDSAEKIDLQKGDDYNITRGTYNVTLSLSPVDDDLYVNVDKTEIIVETGI